MAVAVPKAISKFQSSRSLRTATREASDIFNPLSTFQSSRSLRTATIPRPRRDCNITISILAVLADRDSTLCDILRLTNNFNPRGPCGPRRCRSCRSRRDRRISILAVLADRDVRLLYYTCVVTADFNPRGPCGPRRLQPGGRCLYHRHFNPRGPCGPRRDIDAANEVLQHFNPRGPCGPRPSRARFSRTPSSISILAVLADRDYESIPTVTELIEFQSSRSMPTATPNRARGRAAD